MIRKQKVTVDVQKQALHMLHKRHAGSDRELQHWRGLSKETEKYLLLQMTIGSEISLDRLDLARRHHGEQQDRCARLVLQLNQLSNEIGALEKAIAHAEKALEKYAELFAQRQQERRSTAQLGEWQALDEWVLGARGRQA